jgi:hypothetical protein
MDGLKNIFIINKILLPSYIYILISRLGPFFLPGTRDASATRLESRAKTTKPCFVVLAPCHYRPRFYCRRPVGRRHGDDAATQ